MGLFQHRPEEPTEWGGLPAEPADTLDPVEQLDTSFALDIPLFGDIPARTGVGIEIQPVDPPLPPEIVGIGDGDGDGD